MLRTIPFLFSLAALFLCSVAHAELRSISQILADTHSRYIQPSYAAFQSSTDRLRKNTQVLCSGPSPASLSNARSAFGGTARAWAEIEWLRFGPVMAKNRLERVLFYPDRKSTGLKQVQRALLNESIEVTKPERLANLSVAMQGLGAYEYLVFGKGSKSLVNEPNSFRCAYALAITSNLVNIADELKIGWLPDSKATNALLAPGGTNSVFRSETEAMNFLLGTMIHGLEAIRDVRIGSFLKAPGKDRPRVAVLRRSSQTIPIIAGGLKGLLRLFNESGIERILPAEYAYLGNQLRFEFNQSIQTIDSLNGSIEALVEDESNRTRLAYLKLAIGYAINRLDAEVAPQAGLKSGFSFGDGD